MVKIRSDMLFRIAILILNYTRWIIPIAVGPTAFEFTAASCLADDYLSLIDSKIRRDRPTHAIRNNLFHGNPSNVVVVIYAENLLTSEKFSKGSPVEKTIA